MTFFRTKPYWPILIFALSLIPYLNSYPRWDQHWYYTLAQEGAANFSIKSLFWVGHPSLAPSLYFTIGQILFPHSPLVASIQAMLLGLLAVFLFQKILLSLKMNASLGGLQFAFHPWVFSGALLFGTDFSVVVGSLGLILALLNRSIPAYLAAATLLAFCKESGALLGGLLSFSFLVFHSEFFSQFSRKKGLLYLLIPNLIFVFVILVFNDGKIWESFPPLSKITQIVGEHKWGGLKADGDAGDVMSYRLKQIFFSQGNWILSILSLLSLFQIFSKKRDIKIWAPILLGFLLFLAPTAVFQSPKHTRYVASFAIPLLLFTFRFLENISIPLWRNVSRALVFGFFFFSCFFSFDPVTKHFFGTQQIGRRTMFDFGVGDELVYNSQFISLDRITGYALESSQLNEQSCVVTHKSWQSFISSQWNSKEIALNKKTHKRTSDLSTVFYLNFVDSKSLENSAAENLNKCFVLVLPWDKDGEKHLGRPELQISLRTKTTFSHLGHEAYLYLPLENR